MARREPLIWLQLLGAAALPLELLLVLLLLAGADPGPVPGLERVLAWAIGALAPAVLLWKRPADPFSLLLVQTPVRARSSTQRTLAAAPLLVPRLAGVLAAVLLLPGLWWIDRAAALAGPMALLPDANRLMDLLLAVPVLAVIVWQVQQLAQAAALLLSSPSSFEGLTPLSADQFEAQRLCLGLPLLLPQPLSIPEPSEPVVAQAPASTPTPAEAPASVAPAPQPVAVPAEPIESAHEPVASPPEPLTAPPESEAEPEAETQDQEAPSVADVPVAVEPEQTTEEGNRSDLDQEIG